MSNLNFWQSLPKPIVALAPMEEVTDTVFRQIIASVGKPTVMFTEFTNVSGLQSDGFEKVAQRLKFSKIEKPLIAQIWGVSPEDYYKSAKYLTSLDFDGVDLNFGCPVKKIIQKGACSALIKNPNLAKEIVLATKQGLEGKLPLSIKTRIGFSTIDTENWIGFLLKECNPQALTIHARTVKEESKVPNHFEELRKASSLRNNFSKQKLKNKSLKNKLNLWLKSLLQTN